MSRHCLAGPTRKEEERERQEEERRRQGRQEEEERKRREADGVKLEAALVSEANQAEQKAHKRAAKGRLPPPAHAAAVLNAKGGGWQHPVSRETFLEVAVPKQGGSFGFAVEAVHHCLLVTAAAEGGPAC